MTSWSAAFLSIFNMTNVASAQGFSYPDAMVDYASAAVFELRENAAGDGHDGEALSRQKPKSLIDRSPGQYALVSGMARTSRTACST